jgi:hypothetical protein
VLREIQRGGCTLEKEFVDHFSRDADVTQGEWADHIARGPSLSRDDNVFPGLSATLSQALYGARQLEDLMHQYRDQLRAGTLSEKEHGEKVKSLTEFAGLLHERVDYLELGPLNLKAVDALSAQNQAHRMNNNDGL